MTTADLEEFDPARTHRKLALGSREGVPEAYEPHNVGIWNTAGDTPVSVRVLDPGAETVLHDNTYKMPNNSRVAMELLEPAIYLVEVCVPTTGTTLTLRVPCRLFDCNSSRTMVGVFPDGEIRSRVVSTVIGCQGPEC